MAKKHYPVQRKFTVAAALPNTSLAANILVDRELSRINHRLYRQSRYYDVKVDIDADLPNGTVVSVYALQDTWMVQKAYQFAHKVFLENSKEEMAQLREGAKARWNDFRVTTGNDNTALDAFGYNVDSAGARYTAGEYIFSEVTTAAGSAKLFRWEGASASTFNIIAEYDATGNTNNTPTSVSSDVAYDGLEDELDDNQMDHLSNHGNAPPYSNNAIETQIWVKVGQLFIDADGGGRLSTGFFTAPCGIVALAYGGGANQTVVNEKIRVEVKSGDYKGVSAASMLE